MAGVEDKQIFHAADDAPVTALVHLALVAGEEPFSLPWPFGAVFEHARRLLGAVPVAREDVGSADLNLAALGQLHLDSGNGRADAAGFDPTRVVHGADG